MKARTASSVHSERSILNIPANHDLDLSSAGHQSEKFATQQPSAKMQQIGQKIYEKVVMDTRVASCPFAKDAQKLAGKITGMLLERGKTVDTLQPLLDSDATLTTAVTAALSALESR
eukprot:COSAG06_NODE_2948_length_6041_cov_68.576742_1_plen_117_part_00